MRLGEATSLSVGDVDLDEGTLLVRHAKGDRTRLLPMSQSLREYVATYMRAVVAEGAAPGMPLMPTRNGRIRAGSNCWLALNAIFAEAGVLTSRGRPIRIHDLRHSYAVHALEKMAASGMDLYVALPLLSAYMGHADVKSTEYYLRLTEVAMADLIDVQAPTSDVIFGGVS
jgi:integrase